MFETNAIPDDLETCQRLLRELMEAYGQLEKVHGELLAISTDMRDSQEKLAGKGGVGRNSEGVDASALRPPQ